MSFNAVHRAHAPTKLLLALASTNFTNTVQLYTMPSTIAAASNLGMGRQKVGTVQQTTINSQVVGIYRCNPRDKIARLRCFNVNGSGSGSGTTVQIALGLFPSFSSVQGSAAADSSGNAVVDPVGQSGGAIARGTITFDTTAYPGGTRDTDPFTATAYPGSLTGKSGYGPASISWAFRHSTQQFADDGMAAGSFGSLLVDLSFSEYLLFCLETVTDKAKTGAIVVGLDVECA